MSDHLPHLDETALISDADELLRRIFPLWVVRDIKHPGGYRLSTQAFENDRRSRTPCSVSVRRCALPLEELLTKYEDRSIAGLMAGFARGHDQGVCFWEDENEPGHAYLHGPKSRTIRNALAAEARCLGGPQRWGG